MEIDPSTIRQVTRLLKKMRAYESEISETAYQRLTEIDREEVIEVLTQLLDSPNSNLRCQAAETLVKLSPERGPGIILPYIESADSTFRWVICGLLSSYGTKEAVVPLINVLQSDPEADIRMLAAFALGRISDKRAVPALQRAQQHDKGTDYEGRRVADVAADAIDAILARSADT